MFLVFLVACKPSLQYNGDSITNYPDMEMILRENIEPFQKSPYTYKLLTIEDGKKDSTVLKAAEVDWDAFKKPFLKANIFKDKLDRHYTIDFMTDTSMGKLTLLLTAVHPSEITSKMSVTARSSDNKIMSVYIEARDAGFFKTTEYKLLFVNEKSIQIQERTKSIFSKLHTKITTLRFLN